MLLSSDVEEHRYVVTGNCAYLRVGELDVNYFLFSASFSLVAPGELEMASGCIKTIINIPEELRSGVFKSCSAARER